MKVNTGVDKPLEKLKKESKVKLPEVVSGNKTQKRGTPPSEINPFDDPEWWSICRDEIEFGIPHDGRNLPINLPTGVDGCFECATMCASDPNATGRELECWTGLLWSECIIPEIVDAWNLLVGRQPTCDFQDIVADPNSFRSETCEDSTACVAECPPKCKDEGYTSGSCRKSGGVYFCDCS